MGELLKPLEISRAAKDLYRGTLEVLLILHHDFPEILVENHFQLLNSIPPHCTQMRSLIISAPASSYPELPDPLVHGLKIDRLEGIQHAPVVRTNAGAILEDFEVKDAVDDIIQGLDSFDSGIKNIIHAVQNPPKTATGMGFVPLRVNEILLNAIVLYIVQQAEASDNQRVPKFTSNSRQALLMDCLMERLAPEARYHFVGAIVNQLRYPNSHTAFFCYSLFHLFRPNHGGPLSSDIQMQIIRVLMERFIVHRPHPWGLIVAILELFKNREYRLWDLSFMKALPDVSVSQTPSSVSTLRQLSGISFSFWVPIRAHSCKTNVVVDGTAGHDFILTNGLKCTGVGLTRDATQSSVRLVGYNDFLARSLNETWFSAALQK